mmetsp:Transcript_1293/g.4222  ORF Transcript_1293/g.4222 Transcript_1293/m.4222 type:complete len:244 (-) Transcript_1293:867-1598(-)
MWRRNPRRVSSYSTRSADAARTKSFTKYSCRFRNRSQRSRRRSWMRTSRCRSRACVDSRALRQSSVSAFHFRRSACASDEATRSPRNSVASSVACAWRTLVAAARSACNCSVRSASWVCGTQTTSDSSFLGSNLEAFASAKSRCVMPNRVAASASVSPGRSLALRTRRPSTPVTDSPSASRARFSSAPVQTKWRSSSCCNSSCGVLSASGNGAHNGPKGSNTGGLNGVSNCFAAQIRSNPSVY